MVIKPWGKEYLIHDSNVAVWVLHINDGHRTSFHCHPEKETRLLVLKGSVKVSWLDGSSVMLSQSQKVRLGKRQFHRSKALYDSIVIETEYPNKKSDIVRLFDDYGRSDQIEDDRSVCDPKIPGVRIDHYAGDLSEIVDGDYIFLSGGIMSQDKFLVAPGDILSAIELRKLSGFKRLNSRCLLVSYE